MQNISLQVNEINYNFVQKIEIIDERKNGMREFVYLPEKIRMAVINLLT